MKNKSLAIILLLALGFTASLSFRFENKLQSQKSKEIQQFIKTWGAIKYFSKKVSEEKVNMDSIFFTYYPQIKNSKSIEEYNQLLSDLLLRYNNEKTIDSTLYGKAIIHDWYLSSNILNETNKNLLNTLYLNKSSYNNYYVDYGVNIRHTKYTRELKYSDSINPGENLRMLALARYWNILNYFYPYLNDIDHDWDHVLLEFIPKFQEESSCRKYNLNVLELVKRIQDSHSFTYSKEIYQFLGVYDIPFRLKQVEGKYVIYDTYSDSLANLCDLKIGDEVKKIDNKSLNSIVSILKRYKGGSNSNGIIRNILLDVACGSDSTKIIVEVERNGKLLKIPTKRYYLPVLYKALKSYKSRKPKMKYLMDSICYLNLEVLDTNDIHQLKNKILMSKGLVLDLRKNANGTMYCLSRLLNKKDTNFVSWYLADTNYPGKFNIENDYFAGPKKINNNYYKEPICLLVNEHTQSHGEFSTMALQTAPDVITIGSQTAGADGNVSHFFMPGGIITYFSGLGVLYPDLTPTQRVGIRIDRIVKPTLKGIREGRDEVLEYAVDYINERNKNKQ